jgi:hypothetical protein
VGLKLVGTLVPGKPGTVGLTNPLIIVDRLSGLGFDVGLPIFNLIIVIL